MISSILISFIKNGFRLSILHYDFRWNFKTIVDSGIFCFSFYNSVLMMSTSTLAQ